MSTRRWNKGMDKYYISLFNVVLLLTRPNPEVDLAKLC